MASTRQTSRSNSGNRSNNLTPSNPTKKLKLDSENQESPIQSVNVIDVVDPGKVEQDSDSSLLETVEIEEVDVTEEFVVSMDENSVVLEDDQSSSQGLDLLQMVQTTTSAPGGELVAEEPAPAEKGGPTFVFKDPTFIHSSKGPGGNKKTRIWKNLKQITTAERTMFKDRDSVTYGSIDAPPSFRPAKKYSDISGLEARYTDPQTKLRYTNAEEFQRVRMLPGDIVSGCLTLRKANTLVP